jgi:DNA-binding CsgD family transcriptional regulator
MSLNLSNAQIAKELGINVLTILKKEGIRRYQL